MAGGSRSKRVRLTIAFGLPALAALLFVIVSSRGRDGHSSTGAAGSDSATGLIVTKGPARVETTTPPTGTRLEGQVVDEQDRPVAGARVRMWVKQKALLTTTEGDGSFFFEGVPDGNYAIGASTDQLASAPILAKVAEGAEPVILRLRPAGSVRVRVLAAETDSPISGALVRTSDGQEATTDASGAAEINGLSDFVQLVASAPGRALVEGGSRSRRARLPSKRSDSGRDSRSAAPSLALTTSRLPTPMSTS